MSMENLYQPEELFEDPTVAPVEDASYSANTISTAERLEKLARYWVERFGGEGTEFTKEQEYMLASRVQDGIAAAERLEKGEAHSVELEQTLALGKEAEQALVETNLRFAFVYARESVGIKHEGVRERFLAARGKAGRPGDMRALGTYKPLHVLKSQHAELEDRYSMAAIGLVHAVRRFKPAADQKARFISYASWSIQHNLERLGKQDEHNGVRFPSAVHDSIHAYFGDFPSVSAVHIPPEQIGRLLRLRDTFTLHDAEVSLEDARNEYADPWGEDDRAETLADVWDDPNIGVQRLLTLMDARETIRKSLRTLTDRESFVVRMRSGLNDEDKPFNLDETGKQLGLTKERIRQIESKTMRKLQHNLRAKKLRPVLDSIIALDEQDTYSIWAGDAVRLPKTGVTHAPDPYYPQDLSGLAPFKNDEELLTLAERQAWHERRKSMQSWQVEPEEDWDAPVRREKRQASREELIGSIRILDSVPALLLNREFMQHDEYPYPVLPVKQLKENLGMVQLAPSQISALWKAFMRRTYPRLSEELGKGFNPDRVGQLFSQIIAENVSDNDEVVRLDIPPFASGEIGYLASNLGVGSVEIVGRAGSHVGAWNRGYSVVKVRGSVGAYAGAMMRGNSMLIIKGPAWLGLGIGASGEAEIIADSAKTIGKLYGDAVVRIRETNSSHLAQKRSI